MQAAARKPEPRGERPLARVALGVLASIGLLLVPLAAFPHPAESERIEILSRRIDLQPGDPRPYIKRGAAYSHNGDYERALADLRKAEQLGDPLAVAYELGLLHQRMGRLDLAKVQLDRLLERSPDHARALEQRARLFVELGETQAAVADYERVLATSRRPNPGLYLAAAQLLAAEGPQGVEPALAILDAGIERLGVIPQLQQYAITLERDRNRDDLALDRLEAMESALGAGPDWQIEMAEQLVRLARPDDARRHLERASTQLAGLRQTPARRALAERILTIRSTLDGP